MSQESDPVSPTAAPAPDATGDLSQTLRDTADTLDASAQSDHPPIPGLEILGAGYDVCGYFANPVSVKANLFDFSADTSVSQQLIDESLPLVRDNAAQAFTQMPTELKLFYSRPNQVQFIPVFSAEANISEAETVSEEQSKLTATAKIEGGAGAFSAEISGRYGTTYSRVASSRYYTVDLCSTYYTLSMANYGLKPVSYLRDKAKQDLDNEKIAASDLFALYGTHYIYKSYIGCKITYGQTVDMATVSSSTSVEAALSAQYGSVGGSASVATDNSSTAKSMFSNTHAILVGISDEQLGAMAEIGKKPFDVLQGGWHNPTLVNFDASSLVPIWTLCSQPKRAKELEDAFKHYLKNSQLVIPEKDLTALYLLKSQKAWANGFIAYKLWPYSDGSRSAAFADLAAEPNDAWGCEEAEPCLYVYNVQKPGTVPLYAYRSKTSRPEGAVQWRYETSLWDDYLKNYGPCDGIWWIKASDTPVGYVYDWNANIPSGVSTKSVYIYSPNVDGGIPRYLPSIDPSLSIDQNQWKATATPAQQLSTYFEILNFPGSQAMTLAQKLSAWSGLISSTPGFQGKPDPTTQELPGAEIISQVTDNIHWKVPVA